MKIFIRKLKGFKHAYLNPYLLRDKSKIFCVGRNKTGTTSLMKEFLSLGYVVGRQKSAEHLLNSYLQNDFAPILRYCRTAQVFQDVPFSYNLTYKYLDQAYPGSKFILSIRSSPEVWYDSLVRFHSKLFGNGNVPTSDDLKNATYVEKGWMWRAFSSQHNISEEDPYNKEALINTYNRHNQEVIEYFKGRECLLVIDLSEDGAYQKFCTFLGVQPRRSSFPWENKTISK